MAMEMPPWCGRCDPQTRRFDLGDSERRCPDCNPYWAFGHASIDPGRVPVGREAQEQAVRWLLYELVSLRVLDPRELRRRTRAFFDVGWTPLDIVHALDRDPDGSRPRAVPQAGDPADRIESQVLNLLSAWCDESGAPLASPSQLVERRRDRTRQRQLAAHEAWAELAARPFDPEAAERSGARRIAAEAARRAQQLRLEARGRERAARAQQIGAVRAQQERVGAALVRLAQFAERIGPVGGDGVGPANAGSWQDLEATRHTCEAEIPDQAFELHVVRSGCDAEVSPSVAENRSAGRRPLWSSMRRSVGSAAARRAGQERRAA